MSLTIKFAFKCTCTGESLKGLFKSLNFTIFCRTELLIETEISIKLLCIQGSSGVQIWNVLNVRGVCRILSL